ncbi:hypothetical protein BH10BAC3_BH10BAC3_42220 [soil metagenome]
MKINNTAFFCVLLSSTIVCGQTSIDSLVSINLQSPKSKVTSDTAVIFRATFSGSVKDVTTSSFTLTKGGTAYGIISSVVLASSGLTGSAYDIRVSSISGIGTLRLNLNAAATNIINAAGNAIGGGFTAGQTFAIQQKKSQGSADFIVPLSSISIYQPTKDKPQAKIWTYANQWWSVLSSVEGTTIFRLDGSNWNSILTLSTKYSRADCLVTGNLVHILAFTGLTTKSLMYTVEYDKFANTYKLWPQRPFGSTLPFPDSLETATIAVDGAGRMWAASVSALNVNVWWSDAPYNNWSASIKLADGLNVDDICAITAMPNQGKIGIFWSNQTTKRFGFRIHSDESDPAVWSPDESPAYQSALDDIPFGLSDDHMNIKLADDGTLYCATKTSYSKNGSPKLILLIRRPSGNWDNLYTVTSSPEGTQPLLLLNEVQGKLKVVYSTLENGGDIIYRQSATDKILFGPSIPLFNGGGKLYNYATSTHQNYNSEVVIMATDLNSNPQKSISVLTFDNPALDKGPNIVTEVTPATSPIFSTNSGGINVRAYPNPFSSSTNVNFKLEHSGNYTISLYDCRGMNLFYFDQGYAEANKEYVIKFNGETLQSGLYLVSLKTNGKNTITKLLLNR